MVKSLLEASPEAAAAADKARSSAHYAPPMLRGRTPAFAFSLLLSQFRPATPILRHAPRIQVGGLPLHYASMNGAPFEVMELLLDANRKAAAVVAQARR